MVSHFRHNLASFDNTLLLTREGTDNSLHANEKGPVNLILLRK